MKKIFMLIMTALLSACSAGGGGGGGSPTPAGCAFAPGQVSTNSGGSTGLSNYGLALGNGTIQFNNINLTFKAVTNGGVVAIMTDMGPNCLVDVTTWPGSGVNTSISVIIGHVYIVQFKTVVNGVASYAYSKFIPTDYTGGVVHVDYVPNL